MMQRGRVPADLRAPEFGAEFDKMQEAVVPTTAVFVEQSAHVHVHREWNNRHAEVVDQQNIEKTRRRMPTFCSGTLRLSDYPYFALQKCNSCPNKLFLFRLKVLTV